MCTRPACLSSLRWWETVEGAIFNSEHTSPTHARASAGDAHPEPGAHAVARPRNIWSRLGLDSALSHEAIFSVSKIRDFDIIQNIISVAAKVKFEAQVISLVELRLKVAPRPVDEQPSNPRREAAEALTDAG